MAFDIELGNKLRIALEGKKNITEKNMFGGLAFMVEDKMFCGVIKDKLVVRINPDQNEEALSKPFASQMDFTGKPMKGYVYVDQEGLVKEKIFNEWLETALLFTSSLPQKKKKPTKR